MPRLRSHHHVTATATELSDLYNLRSPLLSLRNNVSTDALDQRSLDPGRPLLSSPSRFLHETAGIGDSE